MIYKGVHTFEFVYMWIFLLTLAGRRTFHRKDFKWRGYGSMGLLSEETEALHAEPNERVEAATSNYSAVVSFLQYLFGACG